MLATPFIQGFGTSAGLIIAIGAQNAFLLSQSIRGNHHLVILFICILCDAVFITVGVAGVGAAVSAHPSLSQWVTWGGAVFLIIYGYRSLRSAIRGGSLETSEQTVQSQKSILWFLCLGLGGGMLAPVFKTKLAWRILDMLICATMWSIAASLILNDV